MLAGTAVVVLGCSQYLPLPEATPRPGDTGCAWSPPQGPVRLAGDADAEPHVWAIGPTGDRHEVTWPSGFKSVFWPELLVLDESSNAVGHAGDDLANPPASFAGLVACFAADGVAVYRARDLRP